MYRNYEGDLLFGKCGPAETCPSYICDRLTFVSGCIVEATNDNQNCDANYKTPHKMQRIGGVRDKYNPGFLSYFGLRTYGICQT